MHHIISDAASHEILVKDFMSLREGKELPVLRLQYKDYSQWQNSERHPAVRQRQEDYWLKAFSGKLPVLNLPSDYPRPPVQSFEGDIYYFKVAGEETASLRKLASKQGATMQIILLAIFYILIARISGQEDIIIGTSVIGRRHPDLENIPGVFTNTLALRNHPSGEKTFLEFLKEVKESSLNAYENQDYPFENLVKKVAPDRDISRNPLFDIMFEIRENPEKDAGLPEQPAREPDIPAYQQGDITAKFDLDWIGFESEQDLSFSVTYCSKLFARESIELMADEFLTLIGSVINNTQSRIKDLDYTASIEKELNKVERIKFKI
jgi:fengycin family lipopeptide synthetase D